MHLVRHTRVIASLALAFLMTDVPAVQAANPSSNWGWAKPLNQRQGLFYTTNQAFKRGSSSRQRSVWTPYRTRRTVQPGRSIVQPRRSTVRPPFFRSGRAGLIPFNPVSRY